MSPEGLPLRRSGAQRLIGVDAWLIWYLASEKPFLGTNSRPKSRPLGVRSQGFGDGPPRGEVGRDRLSDAEWVAFAAISRFRSPILDTIPTGSFLALRQTFSWCYMPPPDTTEVRSSHGRYPGAARQ